MVSLCDLVPGNWYITLMCSCNEKVVLFLDRTNGKGSLRGAFTITCPTCTKRGTYIAEHYYYGQVVPTLVGTIDESLKT